MKNPVGKYLVATIALLLLVALLRLLASLGLMARFTRQPPPPRAPHGSL
jgi:hypothetical protein